MDSDLAQEAINAALTGDWEKAILVNSKILKENSSNIDALNRIARAYVESGNVPKGQLITKKVLKLDPTNPIANRCFLKWQTYTPHNGISKFSVSPNVFIEEPSKTKVISLINLGEVSILTQLCCGDIVKLQPNTHRVNVHTALSDKYIGRFPDDLAARFIKLMKDGNKYEALVKVASKSQVKIFVR